MPISGIDELQCRICRKQNPSPRAAQSYFFSCTTQFSFQYDKQSLRPSHVIINSSDNVEDLVKCVISFANAAVTTLFESDTVRRGTAVVVDRGSGFSNVVIPVLLGSYVVVAFDEDPCRASRSLKKLADLAAIAQLPLLFDFLNACSEGVEKADTFLRTLSALIKQITESNMSIMATGGELKTGWDAVSLSTITKCSFYRTFRLLDQAGNTRLNLSDDAVEITLANAIDCISNIAAYDVVLTKGLNSCGDNLQRQKSFLFELSGIAASAAFAAHLVDQISYQQQNSVVADVLPKKAVFSKITNLFITKLQSTNPSIVGLDSHSLSLTSALHKLFASTRQASFLQQAFLLATAWATSATVTGNGSEEISRRCRFPVFSKLLKDIFCAVDKSSSAKIWFFALEQLSPGHLSTLFQLWRAYIDQWATYETPACDENTSPAKLASSPQFCNRYTLSRAVLFSSKSITSQEDRIAFMFKELQTYATVGSLSQFLIEMKTILRLLSEATTGTKVERLIVAVKYAELTLACNQSEYVNFVVDAESESLLVEVPLVRLICAQGYLLNFMKTWYERQCPRPDEMLVSPTSQSEQLKAFGIIIPDVANRPNCNCFDHAIISPKVALEHENTVCWLQLLRKSADLLLAVESVKACQDSGKGVPTEAICQVVVVDAVNTLYTCSTLLLLMREHIKALSCFLRLRSWVDELQIGADGWNRRLDLLLLQIRIYLLDTGLEGPCFGDSTCDGLAAALKSVPESLSLRMRLFCATTTCTSSSDSASSSLVDCPAHSKPLASCTPICRWLVSSPLCTSFWASTHALTETFTVFDRSKPVRAKHSGSGINRCFGDTILRFADLLDALYFASDVALVAGVFRDAARAAYEGLRYAIRFASTKWIYAFQLQMLESLKFQDKIQHASHYKLLTEASIPDSLVSALMSSNEADDLMLAARLAMKYKIWHELHSRLSTATDATALTTTAKWLQVTLGDISRRVKIAISTTAIVKDCCSVASPLADTQFSAWLHYFDFATRFPGNDLELVPTSNTADTYSMISRVNCTAVPGLPVVSSNKDASATKATEKNDEDLSKVFAPRKPSYEALSIASLSSSAMTTYLPNSSQPTNGCSSPSTSTSTSTSVESSMRKFMRVTRANAGTINHLSVCSESAATSKALSKALTRGAPALQPSLSHDSLHQSLSIKFDESSFQIARYFPLAPVYSELCRLRAVKAYATSASPMVTAYWLHEANTVCFRHMLRAVLAVQRVAMESSSSTATSKKPTNDDEMRFLKSVRLLTRFPPMYEDFVECAKEIPVQWTVISLSVLPPGAQATTTDSGKQQMHCSGSRMAAVCTWRARHRRDVPDVKFIDAADLLLLLMRFEQLMLENEESLRLKTRKEFWKCRLDIDKRMNELMNDAEVFVKSVLLPADLLLSEQLSDSQVLGARPIVVLLLDAWTTPFTWEDVPCMRNLAVTRGLTLPFLVHQLKTALTSTAGCQLVGNYEFVRWPVRSISYVLDPENNLAKTRATFEPIVTTRTPNWSGFVGRFPSPRELLEQLRKTQMFVFIGHGSGLHSTSFRDLGDLKSVVANSPSNSTSDSNSSGKLARQCSASNVYSKTTAVGVLMGCSSLRLVDFRRRDLHNSALFFPLAQSPAVFGNLFNVTDIDIDRFLMGFLDAALTPQWRSGFLGNKDHPPPPVLSDDELKDLTCPVSLLSALALARSGCKLRFLNGSAPVCYGLPLALVQECHPSEP